ncbi:MAG: hypothetical protein SFX73_01730 [Kofleriaceae bacterium]|nr:hypothetical protein [Kofleriaceae bacterium]
MGGHGGDEAGQRAILEDQGIVDLAPMDTSLETTLLGTTPEGVEVHWSRAALECDLTILFNRVAPHPNLSSRLQSGFTKMSVIGFGKPRGATTMHRAGVSEHLEAAGAVVRQHSNLVGGIAMLCDGEGQPSELVGLTVDELPEKELAVLERARAARFTLPFESIDVLVLDWFGKDISPTGIDRVLLGRRPTGADPVRIGAILALGLSPKSRGNMLGVGFADAVTARVLAAMDADQMAANLASSGDVEACTIPRVFENDRQALDWAVTSFGPRIARIESTAHLGQFLVSDGIILPGLTRGDVSPWSFDDAGSLDLREPWMSRRENA